MIVEEEQYSPSLEALVVYYRNFKANEDREKAEKAKWEFLETGGKSARKKLDEDAQEAVALDPLSRIGDEFDEPDVPAIDLS